MFVSHGNIFCNGNKNAISLYETAFLIGVSFFSVNRKRIVLLTLFCLLKNRNNGNFTVPIHKIPVMALLIIRIINFRFRFKRGTACYLHVLEGPRKTHCTMVNRQQTHAIQRGNRQRPFLYVLKIS